MATHLPVPDYDPTNPVGHSHKRGAYPYSIAQMDPAALEGVSVLGYPLNVVAPYARRVVYAVGKLAMGTRKVGRHGPIDVP